MGSATLLLLLIGFRVVYLWRAGAISDWAIFLYGLVALVCLSTFVVTIITYRRDQL
jgi:hypothetical protein